MTLTLATFMEIVADNPGILEAAAEGQLDRPQFKCGACRNRKVWNKGDRCKRCITFRIGDKKKVSGGEARD